MTARDIDIESRMEWLTGQDLEYFWSILREFESIDEDGHILNLTFYDTLEIDYISQISPAGTDDSAVTTYNMLESQLIDGDVSILIQGFQDSTSGDYIERYFMLDSDYSGISLSKDEDYVINVAMTQTELSRFDDRFGSVGDTGLFENMLPNFLEELTNEMLNSNIEPLYKTLSFSYNRIRITNSSVFGSSESMQVGTQGASTIVSTSGGGMTGGSGGY